MDLQEAEIILPVSGFQCRSTNPSTSYGAQPTAQRQPRYDREVHAYAPRDPPPSGGRSAASLAQVIGTRKTAP